MNRRQFLSATAAASAAASASLQGAARLPIQKAVLVPMLPKQLPYRERFELAKACGFEALEGQTVRDPKEAEAIAKASSDAKMPIHSVMNMGHWEWPLSSADPEVVAKSMAAMETSMQNAKLWGADTVLLVPAVVNPQTRYQDAWTRSQQQIRKLIPLAEKLKVVIGVEEVWNKFLLSPLEFAKYVDDFQSPWVRAYFDVGNIVLYAFPQDWIRTLGPRICKLHLKDFRFKNRVAEFLNLRDGDIDWKAVHAALADVGYKGYATVELSGGDEAYLRDVAKRVDLILEGA